MTRPDLTATVAAMPPEERAGALVVLDHLTRPLTRREIEARLRRGGISQARAGKIATALVDWEIIAMMGPGA